MTKTKLRRIATPLFPVLDILLSPLTVLASLLLFSIRKMRMYNMPVSKKIFKKIGVFPITNHYYEPLFDDSKLKLPLNRDRPLPGIDWNDAGQLSLLNHFRYEKELLEFPFTKPAGALSFYYDNPSLGPGDAEYLYCMIRYFKPKKIIEVGSGYSTLMTKAAVQKNTQEDPMYECNIVCIEPYEMPWLESMDVTVTRKLVEEVEVSFFQSLDENDFLFIDSSHIIRPQGDVVYEMLQLLPCLNFGVLVHIHDIFSPGDYNKKLLVDEVVFWNEQYLLEAFLSCNKQFKIIGGLHYLKKHYPSEMMSKLPVLKRFPNHEPGSFWIKKVRAN